MQGKVMALGDLFHNECGTMLKPGEFITALHIPRSSEVVLSDLF